MEDPRRVARAAAVVLLGVGGATLIGSLTRPAAAGALFTLAVVAAAVVSGRAAGVATAIVGSLALNYFFTPPLHTLRVETDEDLIALVASLIAALVVGSLVARVVQERERSARREQESLVLARFATDLLGDRPLRVTAAALARSLIDRLRLAACSIQLPDAAVEQVHPDRVPGDAVEVAVRAGGAQLGALRVVLVRGAHLAATERTFLEGVAGQLGLALQEARMGAEARAARSEAEASRARAALFSAVTHDLRTPLASIKAGVTSLLDEAAAHSEAGRADLLRTISEEADRLNGLVGNLMELARARAGALTIDKQLTPPEDVLESVIARMRGHMAGRELRTLIRPDLPAIWLDPILVDHALTNVLENAVRFSPPSGVVTLAVAPLGSGIQIRVSDAGPGIPPADRTKVFEEFFRGADRGGSGLGLAIAKAVVDGHGGAIRAESAPGGGACIVIEVPAGDGGRGA